VTVPLPPARVPVAAGLADWKVVPAGVVAVTVTSVASPPALPNRNVYKELAGPIDRG
jgi:hypothetical protein